MSERDFIDCLRPLAGPGGLNLDDDAAVLTPKPGQDLVLSKDTMVEGVHFPMGRIGGGFSERLLRVALSDLAAKGARPIGYMLSVAWPRGTDARWIDGFCRGLSDAQASFDCPLLGGDTTATTGPLVATATVIGTVPEGRMVTRAGASAGQQVWHTGALGLAKSGLDIVTGKGSDLPPGLALSAEEAYLRPEPRFAFRKTLRRYATACADISDGIVSEAGHIARASRIAIDLNAPLPPHADFGDDYELLFTAHASDAAALRADANRIGLRLTLCGETRVGEGVTIGGQIPTQSGYRHDF